MNIQGIMRVLVCAQSLFVLSVVADVDFGSSESAILAHNGSIDFGSDAVLSYGTLQLRNGSMFGAIDSNHVTYEVDASGIHNKTTISGYVVLDDAIVLNDGAVLQGHGGWIDEGTVYAQSSDGNPALITGSGAFIDDIWIGASESTSDFMVKFEWTDELNVNVITAPMIGGAYLNLEKDLAFSPGKLFMGYAGAFNQVVFNGYQLTYTDVLIETNQYWYDVDMIIGGRVAIADDVIVTCQNSDGYIRGNGSEITFEGSGRILTDGADLEFSNLKLAGFATASIARDDLAGGAGNIAFTNVTIESAGDGESFIIESGYAACDILDPFGAFGITLGNAAISLNTGLDLLGDWNLRGDATINGNGNVLTLNGGSIVLEGGATLQLRDMTLQIDSHSLNTLGSSAVFLSNVTVVLTETVDWTDAGFSMACYGPTTFIVGAYDFTAPTGSFVIDTTLWVDDIGTDLGYVYGFGYAGTARVALLMGSETTPASSVFTTDGGLSENMYLYADDEFGGRSITFTLDAPGGTIAFDGHGRSLVFPEANVSGTADIVLLIPSADTTVTVESTVFEGVIPNSHFDISGTGASLRLGNQSIFKLGGDAIWPSNIYCGSVATDEFVEGSSGETIIIDCCGHTISLAGAALGVQGAGNTLIIRNGRINGISDALLFAQAGCSLEFENMDLWFVDWATFSSGSVGVSGNCSMHRISNDGYYGFEFSSGEDFTIRSASRLTLHEGMVYQHTNPSSAYYNFTMENDSAVLEMIGASFVHSDGSELLIVENGTFIIDHKAYFYPGDGNLWLDCAASLDMFIRPGAQFVLDGTGQLWFYET